MYTDDPIPFLVALLRPPACVACARPGAWPLCAACLPAEPSSPGPWRLAAGPAELSLWSLGLYGDGLRQAVLAGKFGGQSAALAALGRRLGAALAGAGLGADLVTWIASRPGRRQPRDHAKVLATAVAAALDLPAVRLLHPPPGPDLGRARGGAQPPAGHGAPARPDRPVLARRGLAGGRVLVVDDVVTTGATLVGAAAVLLSAGARTVELATLAVAAAALGRFPGGPVGVKSESLGVVPGVEPGRTLSSPPGTRRSPSSTLDASTKGSLGCRCR